MADFAIDCKSYRRDLARARGLADSLAACNPERLPLWMIVPEDDLALFRKALACHTIEFASDEDVVRCQSEAAAKNLLDRYRTTPGYRSQQVVKADAWRLVGCSSYLCADSDTVFLRPIARSDFISPGGHPFTLLHQSRELLALAHARGHAEVAENFHAESARLKSYFGRLGPDYDFGPQPLVWSVRVWADLHEKFLAPRGWTLWDAIDAAPTEIRWYGEALLASRSILVESVEPLSRVYHHEWPCFALRRLGETQQTLARGFLGAVYQSNWECEIDAPGNWSWVSRSARYPKRRRRQVQAIG